MQFGRFQKEKGLLLSHLPTLSPVVCKLAHSCCVTGKGCPGTQPLTKLFAAKQWQLFTSKPRLNTASIKAQQSKELTLHLGQSTSKQHHFPAHPSPFSSQMALCLPAPHSRTFLPQGPLPGDQGCPSPPHLLSHFPSSPATPRESRLQTLLLVLK